jgi:hypothetical protein
MLNSHVGKIGQLKVQAKKLIMNRGSQIAFSASFRSMEICSIPVCSFTRIGLLKNMLLTIGMLEAGSFPLPHEMNDEFFA